MWLFNMLHGIDNLSIPRNSLQNVACNIYFNHTRCNNVAPCMVAFRGVNFDFTYSTRHSDTVVCYRTLETMELV